MLDALKEATLICKTLFRNGYDAHVVNAPLQEHLLEHAKTMAVDLACEAACSVIAKIFPDAKPGMESTRCSAVLTRDGVTYRFYPLAMENAEHPELSQMKLTPTMAELFTPEERKRLSLTGFGSPVSSGDVYDGFEALSSGCIQLSGLPDDTLRHNYLLAIRALRFAANFDLPLEENTRLAILRASCNVLDYVSATDIMNEWRQVAAESMHTFVRLLYEEHILQGLIPEIASLSSVRQVRNKKSSETEDIFSHTLECMKYYPEGGFHYDWLGTVAMMFHDVGKLYTAEYIDGEWTFYQHHMVGAQVTRKILRRLHFLSEDIDLICHLVRYHMRFYSMMTDRGIRRFMALDEYPRLIEMSRADIMARDDVYTSFNHNMKYLNRAETPERMLEPLLNGNEIMKVTQLQPGPKVGLIRDALLQAQISGDVTDTESAKAFVQDYAKRNIG